MLKIGITGGIGSGKTTVCKIFELLGIPVFYADNVARTVSNTDEILISGIKETFGSAAYSSGGELNRKFIAGIVFNDQKQLKKLNALIHPAVFRAFDNWLARNQGVPYIIKEAALLFESESYKLCDYSVLVISPAELRTQRVMQRDAVSREDVLLRMDKQFPDEKKEAMADFFIRNDEKELLIPQVLTLHARFLEMKINE